MEENGVWSRVWDEELGQIRTTVVTGPATPAEKTDLNGALDGVFDPDTNSLRVVLI